MITLFRSDDVGAPVLSGTAGSLITVLDACLVNGYGSKAAAGWQKPFSGANLAAYRAQTGNRFYLRIDDSHAQYPVMRGYQTLSDINNGTGLFPTLVQLAGGIRGVKSNTASAVARPWVIIASPRAFYLWVSYAATDMGALTTFVDIFFFGDGASYMPGDAYFTGIVGRILGDAAAATTNFASLLSTYTVTNGHYLASDFAQSGNSEPFCCLQSITALAAHAGTAGGFYPDPITGGMLLDRLRVLEGGSIKRLIRGALPGCYNPIHNLPGFHLDTLQGRGDMTGTDMVILYKGGTEGRVVFSLNEDDWHPVV
ncbi:MAG: hypothetical protein KA204_08700 [Chromatiaceae bacterium]|nr:hypothetical protein [Chromatiaceae bacterium]MBP6583521.1 hypothetical protein [Chromatiaceae bacterium]MBP9602844.1 hypothetical protein [Chromatiaceae bacterium]